MLNVPFNYAISNSGVVSCNVKGKMYSFDRNHPNYDAVKEAIKNKDSETIAKLGDLPKTVTDYAGEFVVVKNGNVFYKDKVISNSLTKRILSLMGEGFPFEPMLKFLENLMLNPSFHAVQELYNFLEHRNLPITEDGCFLAYKAVTNDNMDWHTKTVKNDVGTVVSMPRNEVDDNWRTECSSGFHVGAIEYVQGFYAGQGKILIVKVNPKDVVACEGSFQKCRTCEYTIVGEMTEELAKSVYNANTSGFKPAEPEKPTYGNYAYSGPDKDDDNDDYLDDDSDLDEDDDDLDDDDSDLDEDNDDY
jgi:hypothetical protein